MRILYIFSIKNNMKISFYVNEKKIIYSKK